jgi:hypothetical protein
MTKEELLEKREYLFDIAAVLYGEDFVTHESFWGSPTEKELSQVTEDLAFLGHDLFEEVPDGIREVAEKIAREMGLIDNEEEEEDDEEDEF